MPIYRFLYPPAGTPNLRRRRWTLNEDGTLLGPHRNHCGFTVAARVRPGPPGPDRSVRTRRPPMPRRRSTRALRLLHARPIGRSVGPPAPAGFPDRPDGRSNLAAVPGSAQLSQPRPTSLPGCQICRPPIAQVLRVLNCASEKGCRSKPRSGMKLPSRPWLHRSRLRADRRFGPLCPVRYPRVVPGSAAPRGRGRGRWVRCGLSDGVSVDVRPREPRSGTAVPMCWRAVRARMWTARWPWSKRSCCAAPIPSAGIASAKCCCPVTRESRRVLRPTGTWVAEPRDTRKVAATANRWE